MRLFFQFKRIICQVPRAIKTSIKNIGLLGILVGFQLLRGHVQIAYYTWMATGLLIVILLLNNRSFIKDQLHWFSYTILEYF